MRRYPRFFVAALASAVVVLIAVSVAEAQIKQIEQIGKALILDSRADSAIDKVRAKLIELKMGGELSPRSLRGPWRVRALWIRSSEGGPPVEYVRSGLRPGRPCYVLIGKTTFTLRIGERDVFESRYAVDHSQFPPTVKLHSKYGDMLGTFRKTEIGMDICLNDRGYGRPHDFGPGNSGMYLELSRFPNRKLYVSNVDGSDRRLLAAGTVFVRSHRPVWSSDGRKVAFQGTPRFFQGDGDKSHVFVADLSSGKAQDLGLGAAPRWSPDGRKIAFHTAERLYEQIPYSVLVLPRWDESHVWVVDAEEGKPKDLGLGSSSAWSPDGQWIACCDLTTNSTWTMRSDGSEREKIGPGSGHLAWSPDGDELAFSVSGPNGTNIVVFNRKTRTRRILLDNRYAIIRGSICWSPDGRRISFLARLPSMACELVLVDAEGYFNGFRILVPQAGDGNRFTDSACWHKDGKRILVGFHVNRGDCWQLCFVDPEGREPMRPLPGQDLGADHIAPEFSPDCAKIAWTEVVDSDQ